MKVLLLHDYASLAGGGEVTTGLLRDGLRGRGVDARLLATRAPVPGQALGPEYECFGTSGRFRTLLQTANPFAARELRRVLRTFRPDVVHLRIFLTQLSPLVLPLLRDVPCVYHAVWYRAICPLGTKLLPDGSRCRQPAGLACLRDGCLDPIEWAPHMIQRRLFQRWSSAIDLVVANSETVRDRLAGEGIRPIEVVSNGVPERGPRPPLTGPPVVAFAGRLVREKGADLLLHAFRVALERVGDARLLVAGSGPERDRLAALAAELGIAGRTEFLGHLDRADLERRLDAAWVQVLPARWEEPFGLVAAEGMMRGTAIVASDAGGPADLVDHGATGLRVPAGDVGALAEGLIRLLSDRELVERMGAAGRLVALRRLSIGATLERWLEIYRRLGAGRGDRPPGVEATAPPLAAPCRTSRSAETPQPPAGRGRL